MRRSQDIWLLGFLFIALFAGTYYFARPAQDKEDKVASSYNADPRGVRAFYTLLGDRLGYNVQRLTVPFDKIPRAAKVLFVIEPVAMPDSEDDNDEWPALETWVRAGGTLIIASAHPFLHQQGGQGGSKLGKGWVYSFGSPRTITNRGMRDYRNAVTMAALVAGRASKCDLILFDEYHHGYGESGSLLAMLGRPVRMSLIVFVVAALVAAYSQGRRFGAVRQAPEVQTLRPGSEFVEAVGRLYSRAGATDVVAEIVCDSFLRTLCPKLGLAADSPGDVITSRLTTVSGHATAQRVSEVLAVCKRASAGQKPSEQELLHITREIQQIERELGLERVNS